MLKIDVVMFNMSPYHDWQRGVVNRNYHVFKILQKSPEINKIMLVDFPPVNLNRSIKLYFASKIFKKDSHTLKLTPRAKLSKMNDQLYVYSSISGGKSLVLGVQKSMESLGFNNVVAWSYNPLDINYLDAFPNSLRVFDTVDNWIEHPSFHKYRKKIRLNYEFIDQRADLIFTVSRKLLDLYKNSAKVHWIPNGVDLDHFQKPLATESIPSDIKAIKPPIIGYVGVIQSRVDMNLVKYLAERNPDKSFVFIGPVWKDAGKEIVSDQSNVYFLGRKSYQNIPKYMHKFDVGIIPHKADEFTESMNPLKLYEYLACGKPVVTTPISGLESYVCPTSQGEISLTESIEVSKTYEEFNELIQRVITEQSPESKQKRKDIAKACSWEFAVNQMMNYIRNKLP